MRFGMSRRRGALAPPASRRQLSPQRSSLRRVPRTAAVAVLGLVAAGASMWLVHLAKLVALLGGDEGNFIVDGGSSRRRLPPRFPRYGSPEFTETCGWAIEDADGASTSSAALPPAKNASQAHDYVASLVPWVRQSEGIASWVPAVAQAYIYGRYLGRIHGKPPPKLLIEFGALNVSEVFRPPMARRNNPGWEIGPRNVGKKPRKTGWAIGDAYHWCLSKSNNCTTIEMNGPDIVPRYRWIYTHKRSYSVEEEDFEELTRTLPGFSVENGMACALNSIWEPNSALAKYEPELFTRLLPTLRGAGGQGGVGKSSNEETLVLALYLRTGDTDQRVISNATKTRENALRHLHVWDEGADAEVVERKAQAYLRPFVECAQQLEQEYFANYSSLDGRDAKQGGAFSTIVWSVSSDSPVLKRYVRDAFSQDIVLAAPDTSGANDKPSSITVPRHVIYTSSAGNHTKLQWDPSQSAAAQAFVDWYLMGESDALIAEGGFYTFGMTAALRTARPVYVPTKKPYAKTKNKNDVACTRQMLLQSKSG